MLSNEFFISQMSSDMTSRRMHNVEKKKSLPQNSVIHIDIQAGGPCRLILNRIFHRYIWLW